MNPKFHGSYKKANVASPRVSGTITVPSGGVSKNWTVAAGEYADFPALATAIQTAINAQYSGHVVGWSTGLWSVTDALQVYSSASFDLTVSEPLSSFCGLTSGTADLRSTVYYLDGSTPGAFYGPTASLSRNDLVRVYNRDQTHSGTTAYTTDREIDEHTYEARVQWRSDTERAQWRSFLEHARAGTPFRLYVNEDDTSAWTDNNLDGYLDCILPQDQATTAEQTVRESSTQIGYFDMRAIVLA